MYCTTMRRHFGRLSVRAVSVSGRSLMLMCGTTNQNVHLLLTNHTNIVDVSRPAATRHYSSTPPSLGSRARNRIKMYQAEARRNRRLDNHVQTSDKIEQMKRKINGLVAGEKPAKEEGKNVNEKKRTPSIRRQIEKKSTSKHNKADRDDDGVYYSDEKSHRVQERRKRKKKNPPVMMEPKYKPLEAPYSVFVSCLPGVEPLLLQEVQYLQSQWDTTATDTDTTEFSTTTAKKKGKATIVPGGVKLVIPSMAHIYILHLYLGTASHVYLRLNDNVVAGAYPIFRARGFSELKRKLKDMMTSQQWNKLLLDNSHPLDLQVHVTTSKSKLMHTIAVEERVWETLGDIGLYKLRHADKSDGDVSRPIVRLLVRIDRDEVQVSLDTSSSSTAIPLHMRGYRLEPWKAPLREDLAFALLLAGGLKPAWDLKPLLPNNDGMKLGNDSKESSTASRIQLFDPLCGSGTIAIEGCSILAGLPPGRFRPAPLQGTSLCNPALWEVMKSKSLSASLLASSTDEGKQETPSILVAANDINQVAISAAKSNAKRAGVEQLIDFKVGSFKIHPLFQSTAKKPVFNLPHEQTLHVVTNPPFVGKRLSTPNESKSSTYKKLAKSIFSLPYKTSCTIIGNDPRQLRQSSLPLDVAFSTKHGGLSVLAMTGQISKSSI